MNTILTEFTDLPLFSKIRLSEIQPKLISILRQNRLDLKKLLKKRIARTWDNFMLPLEELEDRLSQFRSIIEHLNSVNQTPSLRKIYSRCLFKLVAYRTELAQNTKLYRAIQSIVKSASYKQLSPTKKRIIQKALCEFKLSGTTLDAKKKQIFRQLKKRHAELTTKFEENLLDATRAWVFKAHHQKELAGLPEHIISEAKLLAKKRKTSGWILTLDFHMYSAVIIYADNRELRKKMYEAYSTRASDQGPATHKYDNTKILEQILDTRDKMAKLVGFKHYSQYSLATKMAKNPSTVFDFLYGLAKRIKPLAKKEFKTLQDFVQKHYGIEKLEVWDIAYYSEKMQYRKYKIRQQQFRNYFPVDKVISGLFELTQKLYSITIIEKQNVNRWHKDVRYFEIYDKTNTARGAFYADLYARPKKHGGAWMAECRNRRILKDGRVQLPLAFLNCNFTPPQRNQPTLLTHEEVTTLFHEFGHTLHHLLSTVDELGASGMNGVPWDAVELPSQFMEGFCWEKQILDLMTKHYHTCQKMSALMHKKLLISKTFQTGMYSMRQVIFALFDMRIHHEYNAKQKNQIQKILQNIRQQCEVIKPPAFNRFQNSFSHIFAGGYAAGYYSYKWAEVLSCDAFALFKQHGLFDEEISQSFLHNILEIGGSRDMMKAFIKFRGRKPSIMALLKDGGIV